MDVVVSVGPGLLDQVFSHLAVLRDLLLELFHGKPCIDQRCGVEAVFSYLCGRIGEDVRNLSLHARSGVDQHVALLL